MNIIERFKIRKAQGGMPLLPLYDSSFDVSLTDDPNYKLSELKRLLDKQKYLKELAHEGLRLLYDTLSVFDPTGITSWPDVYNTVKKAKEDGEINGTEVLAITWSTLGALPMVGKVTAPMKLAKIAEKVFSKNKDIATNVIKFLNKGNAIIDTVPEYWSVTRGLGKKIQDFTSKGTNFLMFYAPWITRSMNNKDYVKFAYGLNRTADAFNIINTSSDMSLVFKDLYTLYNYHE